MRVFVSEFLAGGASAGSTVPASMRREGLAMLRAVIDDISKLPDYSVVTTIETGLSAPLRCEAISIETAEQETVVFQQLLTDVDAVLVIAPETGGILANRCKQVRVAGVSSWNCAADAIELCGDKFQLFKHLQDGGLPTIPTSIADFDRPIEDVALPVVLKPRDGAGSYLTFLIRNAQDWTNAANAFRGAGLAHHGIMQPFVSGRALSAGVNISLDGQCLECLPVGEQRLSADGRFHYLGGVIPAPISSVASDMIQETVVKACRSIQGLAGYIGIDVLLPDEGEPLIVEINPRLTTAYVGYRQLFSQPLPLGWVSPNGFSVLAKSGTVEFAVPDASSLKM